MSSEEKTSVIENVKALPTFLSESVDEFKKVSMPTRQETIQATTVTIFIMCFVAVCLFILDLVFNVLMKQILG